MSTTMNKLIENVLDKVDSVAHGDVTAWSHDKGICKLIRVPRAEIDADEDGSVDEDLSPAWDLLWIDSGNVRRFSVRIDREFGRVECLDPEELRQAAEYLATAPDEE